MCSKNNKERCLHMSSHMVPTHCPRLHVGALHLQCHNNAGEEADSMRAICSHWPPICVESDLCSATHSNLETHLSSLRIKDEWIIFSPASFGFAASEDDLGIWIFHHIFWLAYFNLALISLFWYCDWSALFLVHGPYISGFPPFMYSGVLCLASSVNFSSCDNSLLPCNAVN